MKLKPIDATNYKRCISLEITSQQQKYLPSNASSLSQAYGYLVSGEITPKPFGVYHNNTMIGFVMVEYHRYDKFNDEERPIYYLPRIMIHKCYQGKGYGKQTLSDIIDYVRARSLGDAERFYLACSTENETAYNLYESFGFKKTGMRDEDGDIVMYLEI